MSNCLFIASKRKSLNQTSVIRKTNLTDSILNCGFRGKELEEETEYALLL